MREAEGSSLLPALGHKPSNTNTNANLRARRTTARDQPQHNLLAWTAPRNALPDAGQRQAPGGPSARPPNASGSTGSYAGMQASPLSNALPHGGDKGAPARASESPLRAAAAAAASSTDSMFSPTASGSDDAVSPALPPPPSSGSSRPRLPSMQLPDDVDRPPAPTASKSAPTSTSVSYAGQPPAKRLSKGLPYSAYAPHGNHVVSSSNTQLPRVFLSRALGAQGTHGGGGVAQLRSNALQQEHSQLSQQQHQAKAAAGAAAKLATKPQAYTDNPYLFMSSKPPTLAKPLVAQHSAVLKRKTAGAGGGSGAGAAGMGPPPQQVSSALLLYASPYAKPPPVPYRAGQRGSPERRRADGLTGEGSRCEQQQQQQQQRGTTRHLESDVAGVVHGMEGQATHAKVIAPRQQTQFKHARTSGPLPVLPRPQDVLASMFGPNAGVAGAVVPAASEEPRREQGSRHGGEARGPMYARRISSPEPAVPGLVSRIPSNGSAAKRGWTAPDQPAAAADDASDDDGGVFPKTAAGKGDGGERSGEEDEDDDKPRALPQLSPLAAAALANFVGCMQTRSREVQEARAPRASGSGLPFTPRASDAGSSDDEEVERPSSSRRMMGFFPAFRRRARAQSPPPASPPARKEEGEAGGDEAGRMSFAGALGDVAAAAAVGAGGGGPGTVGAAWSEEQAEAAQKGEEAGKEQKEEEDDDSDSDSDSSQFSFSETAGSRVLSSFPAFKRRAEPEMPLDPPEASGSVSGGSRKGEDDELEEVDQSNRVLRRGFFPPFKRRAEPTTPLDPPEPETLSMRDVSLPEPESAAAAAVGAEGDVEMAAVGEAPQEGARGSCVHDKPSAFSVRVDAAPAPAAAPVPMLGSGPAADRGAAVAQQARAGAPGAAALQKELPPPPVGLPLLHRLSTQAAAPRSRASSRAGSSSFGGEEDAHVASGRHDDVMSVDSKAKGGDEDEGSSASDDGFGDDYGSDIDFSDVPGVQPGAAPAASVPLDREGGQRELPRMPPPAPAPRTSTSGVAQLPSGPADNDRIVNGRRLLGGKYEVVNIVGEGAYGLVMKCTEVATGRAVAIKSFKTEDNAPDAAEIRRTSKREVTLLRALQHPHVIGLVDEFYALDRLFIVMDFVPRTLLEMLEAAPGGLDHQVVRKLIYQLCSAMAFIHSKNVVYRDIKPENLLVDDSGSLKLCDFGFARYLNKPGEALTDYVATRWYRAPELLLGPPYKGGDANSYVQYMYSAPIDMWAIGCLLVELLEGEPLFPGDTEVDQLYKIQQTMGPLTPAQQAMFAKNPSNAGVHFSFSKENSTSLAQRFEGKLDATELDFLSGLLCMDPEQRLTGAQALQHAYLKDVRL